MRTHCGKQANCNVGKKATPCGSAINWTKGHTAEATLATTGLRLGSTDKTPLSKRQSTICKASILQRFREVWARVRGSTETTITECSYKDAKLVSQAYQDARSSFLVSFSDWACNDSSYEDFGAKISDT